MNRHALVLWECSEHVKYFAIAEQKVLRDILCTASYTDSIGELFKYQWHKVFTVVELQNTQPHVCRSCWHLFMRCQFQITAYFVSDKLDVCWSINSRVSSVETVEHRCSRFDIDWSTYTIEIVDKMIYTSYHAYRIDFYKISEIYIRPTIRMKKWFIKILKMNSSRFLWFIKKCCNDVYF